MPKLELGHCLVSLRADLSVGLAVDMWQSWLSGHAGLLLMILASRLEDQDILSLSDFDDVADIACTVDLDKRAGDEPARASSLTDVCMTPSCLPCICFCILLLVI